MPGRRGAPQRASALLPPLVALLAALSSAAPPAPAQDVPLPGQIVRHPQHRQWLARHGGEHVFLCGPGDPEDFLHRGTLLPDGTRDGDQDELIDRLVAHGGNVLYVQAVRSHGGDGPSHHNPFVGNDPAQGLDQDVLDQWDGWFDRCDEQGIVVTFYFYDDSTRIWSTGNQVGPEEEAFFHAIVDRFEHHPNLIWVVSEESEEAMSDSRTRALAAVIAAADDHGHLVGNHHHSGTTFKAYTGDSAFDHFSMHHNVAPQDVHAGALEARALAEAAGPAGHGYQVMYTECLFTKTADDATNRRFLWDSALAGVMPLLYGEDIASTSDALLGWCRILQRFFEDVDLPALGSRDDLARAGTRWLLAAPPHGYVAYAAADEGDLGIASVPAGFYDLLWVDAVSGARSAQAAVAAGGGDLLLARPSGIGGECAVWARRVWRDLGFGLPGVGGAPGLGVHGTLEPLSPLVLAAEGAPPGALCGVLLGFSDLRLPFQGGTLVPSPDVLHLLVVEPSGGFAGGATYPGGLPPGTSLWLQCWFADPTGPFGWTASNARQGVVP